MRGTSARVTGSLTPRRAVAVRVVDADWVSGLAADAKSVLEAEGFVVGSVSYVGRHGLRGTFIRCAGARAKAELVAALFPGGRLEYAGRDVATDGGDVVVLLGTGWAKQRQA